MKARKWLSKIGLSDWIAIVSFIISSLLAIYMYFTPFAEQREPVLFVSPIYVYFTPTTISPLSLTKQDGKPVTKKVMTVTFFFWNAGKMSIKRENVIKPLSLSMADKDAEIISTAIISRSRDAITADIRKVAMNEIRMDFNILEEKDGFVAQVTYLGKSVPKLMITGDIEGVKRIKTNGTLIERIWPQVLFLVFSIIAGFIGLYYYLRLLGYAFRFWMGFFKNIRSPRSFLLSYGIPKTVLLVAFSACVIVGSIQVIQDKTREYQRSVFEQVPDEIFKVKTQAPAQTG